MASHYVLSGLSARAAMVLTAVGGLYVGQTADAGVRGKFDYPLEVIGGCAASTSSGDGPTSLVAVYEVTIPVSFRTTSGNAGDVRQIEVELTFGEEAVQLVDYEPRTSLVSDIVGEIEEKTTQEDSRSWNGSVAASIPVPGLKAVQVGPSANISDAERTVRTESVRRRPKMEAVVVAGNASRGKGVFFQLRPGPEVTLEGAHHFTLRIVAPRDLHAATLTVKCRAIAVEDWLLFTRNAEIARSRGQVKILFASAATSGDDPPSTRAAVASDLRAARGSEPGDVPPSDGVPPGRAPHPLHSTQRPCPWCDESP
jgi:hypothetical protein